MRVPLATTVYHTQNVMLRAGTSGSGTMAGISRYRSAGAWTAAAMNLPVYSSPTSRTAVRNDGTVFPALPYFWARLVYDGTNITYQVSDTGHDKNFFTFGGPESAAGVIGGAPGRFALTMDNFGGSTPVPGFFEYARFTP